MDHFNSGQNSQPTSAARPAEAAESDDELMIRLQAGDAKAFDALVERHQNPLVGFFVANTRDRQLAEDLTQETLLRVYDQAWDYLPTGRFRGWLYRIARNLMIDTIRRQSRDALIRAVRSEAEEPFALASIAGDVLSPDDDAGGRELAALVDAALAKIPDEQRLTFSLHHFAGLSLPEIAQILETSVSTTKSRLRLARERLREALVAQGVATPHDATSDEANKSH